jgi:glycosyltransferase involved in cell wall biosynthesis
VRVLFLPDYSAANAYQRELSAALERLGVTVRGDPTRRRRLLPVTEAILRQGRPDLLHLHWTEPYIAAGRHVSGWKARRMLTELRVAQAAGCRLVWTAHDLFRHDRPADPRERAFMRALASLADAVIVHCEAARAALAGELDLSAAAADRLAVVPHGHYRGAYPDVLTRSEARDRLDLAAGDRVVAFVGWLRPYKGVAELLEAFSTLPHPEARLVVAGRALDEGYAAHLAGLAAADERIRLRPGFVPDEELQIYLRAADVVAAPFLEIFTSGSVLLAMSFGRAVIAPRRGCVSETLDEAGGLLYDPDDPGGLQGALQAAMSADLVAMGAHNEVLVERYDWSTVAQATLHVYERACSRKP